MKTKNKKWLKSTGVNVLMSLAISILAYLSYISFKPSIEEMFVPVIFILTLILLEVMDKK